MTAADRPGAPSDGERGGRSLQRLRSRRARRAAATGSASDGDRLRPDPASRFQPDGPHEPSAYVDPHAFAWTDRQLEGSRAGRPGHLRDARRHVHARRHLGAPRRTQLAELARIGITVIEMMPVAEFPGRFGWGYDGVDLYAPTHLYGTPDDLRAFVDRAHAARPRRDPRRRLQPPRSGRQLPRRVLARLLHRQVHERLGPRDQLRGAGAGARVLRAERAPTGSTSSTSTACGSTRRRTSTTRRRDHVIADDRARGARRRRAARSILVVAENEPQDTRIVRRDRAAAATALDALWNDDFAPHGAGGADRPARGVLPRLPGHRAGADLVRALRLPLSGAVLRVAEAAPRHAGARSAAARVRHATSRITTRSRTRAFGRRLHQLAAPARYRAMTAWLLLGPATPMLFQGQEFCVVDAVPLLRRPQAGARRGGARRPRRVPRAVPQPDRRARSCGAAAAGRRRDVRRVQARFRRARAPPRGLRAALRSAARCGATTPCCRAPARIGPKGRCSGPARFVLRYLDRRARRSPAARQPRTAIWIHAGARAAARAAARCAQWRLAWSSEAPRTAGRARRRSTRTAPWLVPGGCALFFVPEHGGR